MAKVVPIQPHQNLCSAFLTAHLSPKFFMPPPSCPLTLSLQRTVLSFTVPHPRSPTVLPYPLLSLTQQRQQPSCELLYIWYRSEDQSATWPQAWRLKHHWLGMPHVAVVELHLQAHTTHISDLLVSHQNIDNICYRSIQADFPVTVLMTHPDCEYQPPKHMFHHLIAAVNLGFVARVVQRDFFFSFFFLFYTSNFAVHWQKSFFFKEMAHGSVRYISYTTEWHKFYYIWHQSIALTELQWSWEGAGLACCQCVPAIVSCCMQLQVTWYALSSAYRRGPGTPVAEQ